MHFVQKKHVPNNNTGRSIDIHFEPKDPPPSQPKPRTPVSEFHMTGREFNARYAFGKRDILNMMAKVGVDCVYPYRYAEYGCNWMQIRSNALQAEGGLVTSVCRLRTTANTSAINPTSRCVCWSSCSCFPRQPNHHLILNPTFDIQHARIAFILKSLVPLKHNQHGGSYNAQGREQADFPCFQHRCRRPAGTPRCCFRDTNGCTR